MKCCSSNAPVTTDRCTACRTAAFQVSVPLAGRIAFSNTTFVCPASSNFKDEYGGRYGDRNGTADGAFPVVTAYCAPQGTTTQVLCSALQFQCAPCADGSYSFAHGVSDGAPGRAVTDVCLPCPTGGQCVGGNVVALPGYWGAVVTASDESLHAPVTAVANGSSVTSAAVGLPAVTAAVVSFMLCPAGYCCDSSEPSASSGACTSIQACRVGRTGSLCGDCAPGFVSAVGSSQCVPARQCDSDIAVTWPVIVLAITALAAVQLALVSAVWRPAASPQEYPSGKLKLAVYFAQVSRVETLTTHARMHAHVAMRLVSQNHLQRRVFCILYSHAVLLLSVLLSFISCSPCGARGNQMTGFVVIAVGNPSRAEETLVALLRMQLPSSDSTATGFCVMRTLDAVSKVGLEAAFQLSVGVAMVVVVCATTLVQRLGVVKALATTWSSCRLSRSSTASRRDHEMLSLNSGDRPRLHEPLLTAPVAVDVDEAAGGASPVRQSRTIDADSETRGRSVLGVVHVVMLIR